MNPLNPALYVVRCGCPIPAEVDATRYDALGLAFLTSLLNSTCARCGRSVRLERSDERSHLAILQGGAAQLQER